MRLLYLNALQSHTESEAWLYPEYKMVSYRHEDEGILFA